MRTVGGARRGLNLWLLQRASAVLMVVYLPSFLFYVMVGGPLDFAAWRGLFAPLTVRVSTLLFIAALLVHAWIGLREILIDYVHPMALRLPLYFLFAAAYLACLVWAADILWSVAP